jgi:glyoxylase-like metal-dependent hydrolase (beta-lactamase superfamily II)
MDSDVVHMGDIYFSGMYPFIDYSSGGSIDGVIGACDMALGMMTDKTKVIPGHGPLSNREGLRAYRDMLRTVMSRVRVAVSEGKTDEEIANAGLTKDLDEQWGKGFLKPFQFAPMIAAGMRKAK